MIAANSASSSSYDVRISARMLGSTERTARHTSIPEPSGSRPSSTATSGRSAGIRAVASTADAGLADHLDVVLALEQEAQALADDVVVVEEEDADRARSRAIPADPRRVRSTYAGPRARPECGRTGPVGSWCPQAGRGRTMGATKEAPHVARPQRGRVDAPGHRRRPRHPVLPAVPRARVHRHQRRGQCDVRRRERRHAGAPAPSREQAVGEHGDELRGRRRRRGDPRPGGSRRRRSRTTTCPS